MASCKLLKKSQGGMKAARGQAKAGDFSLLDNEDDTGTVNGVNAAGNPVDISNVATITVTSDNPAVLSVDPPQGTTFKVHGATPGTCNLSIVATWNDGTVGPFTITEPMTVSAGGPTGVKVDWGTPTVR